MKTIFRYKALGFAALLAGTLASCINDDEAAEPKSQDVKVSFVISGDKVVTRANTEAGSNDLNENTVAALDMFVVKGNSFKHLAGPTYADASSRQTWELSPEQLTRAEAEGATVYLVANANGQVKNATSLDGLKAALTATLTRPDQKQTTFVLDGKGTFRQLADGTLSADVDLSRALAKVRIGFTGSNKPSLADVTFHFTNFAPQGTVLAEGTGTPAATVHYPAELVEANKYTAPTLTQTVGGTDKLVFYTYQNDWFDSSKNPALEEPIDPDKQSFILLNAPYKGTHYIYKIPLNMRLPENNDVDITDMEQIHDLYRLKRNCIYDITVDIDQPGGTEDGNAVELPIKYKVIDWEGNVNNDITIE